jgi:hypothetical protein
MFLNTKKLVVATLLSMSATSMFAAGTLSGTNVDSTASLSFTVNGTTSEVTSTNSYKVDNKVDLVVSTVDTQAVTVAPDKTNVVLTFKVRNDGNTVQDFLLTSKTTSTTAFTADNAVTDSIDLSNVRVFVDSNNNGIYDEGTDTETFIDELAPDADKTVFIVADVPADAANDAIAVYDLEAQVAQGDTAGAEGSAITDDNSNQADDAATVQIVFADGQGTTDGEHDGKHSSADAWKIVTADVTVSKNSIVVSDPVNGTTNPKRIPGAVVRYCYIVENAEGGAEATGAVVTDTLDTSVLDLSGSTVATYSGSATCTCDSAEADIQGSNGANGQDPDAQGVVKVDFDTVAGGTTECAYVSATIK